MNNDFEKNFDLKSILDQEGVEYTENHKHFFLKECPECGKEYKFNIDKKSKMWICWSCIGDEDPKEAEYGKGNLWSLLLTIGFDEHQVKKLFKGKKFEKYIEDFKFERMCWDDSLSGSNSEDSQRIHEVKPFALPHWYVYLDRTDESIRRFTEAYQYLWSRFVRTKEQIQNFVIYYDDWRKRIVFPAITRNGICIGAQSRDITERHKQKHPKCGNPECDARFYYYFRGEEEAPEKCWSCGQPLIEAEYPKSINSTNFPKTEFFFNEQNIDWSKPVVIVEGPFDAINVHNGMACLGKFLSETQFSILLEKNPPKVILYLDGDKPGTNSTVAIYNQVRPFFDVEMVYIEDGDDAGAHSLEENQKRIDSAYKPKEWYTRKGLVYL